MPLRSPSPARPGPRARALRRAAPLTATPLTPASPAATLPAALRVATLRVTTLLVAALLVAALLAPAVAARAQDARDEGGTLRVAGDDAGVRVTLGGYVQADGRWANLAPTAGDGVLLRRARLVLEVTTPEGWQLRLQPDFGRGRALLQDGFVAWRRAPAGDPEATAGAATPGGERPIAYELVARLGRFRPAFGVERTQSSATLLFPERSLVNSFMPSRLGGVQVALTRPHLELSAGVFRAAAADVAIDTDGDPDGIPLGGRDAAARVVLRPLGGDPAHPARVELHLGVMAGHERGVEESPGLERFLTPGQRPALAYRSGETPQTIVLADGGRERLALGVQAVAGPVHALVEGVRLTHRVRLDRERAGLAHLAWAARAGWLLRGRRGADFDVRPRPGAATERGAAAGAVRGVELGVRAAGVRFDPAAAPFATSASARALASGGLALALVPRVGTRIAASWDVTRRARGWDAPDGTPGRGGRVEHALGVRVQQGF